MSKEIDSVSINDFVKAATYRFGHYKNTQRDIPSVFDGLKPSYRRVIYAAYELKDWNKTAKIIGDTLGNWHPHGDSALIPVVGNLVDYGILDGQGGHGTKHIDGLITPPSAPRYTEARLNPEIHSLIKFLLPYIPYSPNYDGKRQEPEYLPTPIPFSLTTGSSGIGIGVNQRMPAFSYKSLFNAYINNDPNLLEAPKGLIIDKEDSELERLWLTGEGRIRYRYNVEFHKSDDAHGVMIHGSSLLFLPNMDWIDELIEDGLIFGRKESSEGVQRYFVARHKGIRKVSDDELFDICYKAASIKQFYSLNVTDGSHFFKIPLYKWIDRTYNNYVKLLGDYKQSNISKLEYDIKVLEILPETVNLLLTKYDNYDEDSEELTVEESIAKDLKVDVELIKSVMKKTISTLKRLRHNTQSEISKITPKLAEFKNYNEKAEVKRIVENITI